MKLFPKLALTISCLLMGTTGGLSFCFYWTEQRHIRQEAKQEQQAILNHLVHIAQESLLTNDDLLLVKYAHWLQKWNPSMISASVVNTTGDVMAHSQPSRIGKPKLPSQPSRSEVVVLSEPIRLGPHWMATASVSFSERAFDETIRSRLDQLQSRLKQVALVSLSAGIVVSFLLALSLTRPIGRLAHLAGRVGQGQWNLDLGALERRHDELGFLSRAFQQMAEQLQQLDLLKEDFVSAVTHELRSPLGAIESYLNLISHELRQGIPLPLWENYVERLRVNTQRLSRFVNDLLDVAALERGKMTLNPQSVDVFLLAQDVLNLFAAKLLEKKLQAHLQGIEGCPHALADPEKVREVLVNLLSNGIKFTPEGGEIYIRLEHLAPKRLLRVSVTDTGRGIAEEDQTKIFNKFEQVRAARQSVKGPKGTGLGLAISRALVELHGGTLWVQSRLEKGSTFFFTLPVTGKEKP